MSIAADLRSNTVLMTLMTNPLHAAYYADRACQQQVTVLENVRLARDTYRVRFECPELAARIVPGQFLMLRLAGCNDPLLGRPLALYDTVLSASGAPIGIDVVYLVLGKMTRRLATFVPARSSTSGDRWAMALPRRRPNTW